MKNQLKARQKVLFSGTPCQVAGLKAYLKGSGIADDGSLLTIEVLCHGVSSRKVVLHYVDWLAGRSGKTVKELRFSTKKRRWYDKGSSMEIHYDDGTEQVIDRHADPFYLVYNNSMNLRPSCYSCRFAKIDRVADITIGDFLGAENFIKDEQKLNDGISLVMVNSESGRALWDCAQNMISAESLDIKKAIPRNGAIIKPVTEPMSRQKFFDGLEKYNFGELVEKCFGRNRLFKIRIKGAIGEERIRLNTCFVVIKKWIRHT